MSYRVKVVVPIHMDEEGVKLRASQLPDKWKRPGYEVDYVSAPISGTLADGYYDALAIEIGVFEEGLKAQDEGYDALGIDTISDASVAFYALRSRLDIPVLGAGLVSYNVACTLGHKFSVITMWDEWFHFYIKSLRQYGLEHRLASMRSIKTRPDLVGLFEGKEEETFRKLEYESLRAINEDGADVIVLGSTTMHQAHQYLTEHLPVPVINPGLMMWKMMEVYLELGYSQSKAFYEAPVTPRDAELWARDWITPEKK